jgi:hypothetical protein
MVPCLPAYLDARLAPLIAMGYEREKCEEAYRARSGAARGAVWRPGDFLNRTP